MPDYHTKSIPDLFESLKTSREGLSQKEAEKRIEKYGYNEIKEKKGVSPLKILLSQFTNFLIIILIIAMAVSFLIGEKLDAIIIGSILVINAVLGFIQEYKAEKAIQALKKLASPQAVVLRDGKEKKIPAKELVPGDIIIIETGEKIPADSRLIESINLQTQEASLTGESVPVKKDVFVIKGNVPIAEKKNMLFAGTIVTSGRGRAAVTGTGMETEIGKIAEMIQEESNKFTPLQEKLEKLARIIGISVIIISIIVFFVGVFAGNDKITMFITAVSLAVAAIPEGLPAVVTISLALGIRRMIKRHALIRKLPSVETLGSTTVICTDKTGTLTLNQMTVKNIFTNDKIITVSGSGYKPEGKFYHKGKEINTKEIELVLKIGALCNNSRIDNDDVIGDPTEGSLIVSAAKAGIIKDKIQPDYPRIGELEFTSERKRMSTLHKTDKKNIIYSKGAPEIILGLCDKIYKNGKIERLSSTDKKDILNINETFAKQALRVLAFAYKESDKLEEDELVFVGLQAMIDPPRDGIKHAIAKCKKAGIKVVMITGDFKLTAEAIAEEIGLKGKAIDGNELDKIEDLSKEVDEISIYARVNPEHKVKILEALRQKGHVVAMTGDGVNDAPAIKKADIGISMGITGTDVAKEASDMILTDDNFISIVNAVEEGRGVYDNIRKFFAFLISGNIGEVFIVLASLLMGLPLPLTAIQILLINLVTDGLPATALSADPFEPGAMNRKPRKKNEEIYHGLSSYIIIYPLIMLAAVITIFSTELTNSGNLAVAQTKAFVIVVMFELYQAFSCRSVNFPAHKVGIFKNKWLVGAVLISFLALLSVIYIPQLQTLFDTAALSIRELIFLILLSSIGGLYLEINKFLRNKKMGIEFKA